MKTRNLLLFVSVVLLQSSALVVYGSYSSLWLEIDATAIVTEVISGDTFNTSLVGEVRMAAIDTSENEEGAKEHLESLIQKKLVHLDLYGTGGVFENGNLLCTAVYVRHNETHLTDVGKALINEGVANASSDNNNFDSGNLTLHVYYPIKDVDYQEILLNSNTQKLVSHSATLFAASIASFTFITGLIQRASKRGVYSKIVFVISSGVLLGITSFIMCRISYYGYRESATIQFPLPSEEYPSLITYTVHVEHYLSGGNYSTGDCYEIPLTFDILVRLYSGLYLHNPFGGFWLSMYSGILLAHVIFWAFTDNPFRRPRRWIGFSIVPLIPTALLACGRVNILDYAPTEYRVVGGLLLLVVLLSVSYVVPCWSAVREERDSEPSYRC